MESPSGRTRRKALTLKFYLTCGQYRSTRAILHDRRGTSVQYIAEKVEYTFSDRSQDPGCSAYAYSR